MDIGPIEDLVMVPCGDEKEGHKDRSRRELPGECRSDRDVKHDDKSDDKSELQEITQRMVKRLTSRGNTL